MIRTYRKSNGKYLLLLKADEFLRDRCIVAGLRDYSGPVFGMARNPAYPKNRNFDHVLSGDPHLPSAALTAVREFERETGLTPEAVIPVTEMTLESALAIAEHYQLSHLPRVCVERARNKHLMKQAFLDAGLPTSRYALFKDLAGLHRAADIVGFPLIIKPCSAAHSVGVLRVDSRAEIDDAYAYAKASVAEVEGAWQFDGSAFQAEEYFAAEREVSVEVINHASHSQVVTVTEKYLTPPPFFAEVGHVVPSPDVSNQRLCEVALAASRSLGIDRGVSHVEVRINPSGQLSLIEVAARPGGDGIMDLVERAYGVNMYDLHIRSYLGRLEPLPERLTLHGTSAIAFMPAPEQRGTVRAVNPPEQLPSEVISLYLNAKIGDQVGGSTNYDARLGAVELFWPSATAPSAAAHLEIAERLAKVSYTIDWDRTS